MIQALYLQSSQLIKLVGLTDQATGQYVNTATVGVTLFDSTDTEVSGETWPLALDYIAGSNGDYQGTVSFAASYIEGDSYDAVITAQSGGVVLTKRTPLKAVWSE